MTRRFTKRSPKGHRGKSTLLTGLKKMKTLFKEAKTNVTLTKSTDNEGTLNKMAMWLGNRFMILQVTSVNGPLVNLDKITARLQLAILMKQKES